MNKVIFGVVKAVVFATHISGSLLACSTPPFGASSFADAEGDGRREVIFTNTSGFNVSISRDSYGGGAVCEVRPGETKKARYVVTGNEIVFYPRYDIPIGEGVVEEGQIDESVFFVIQTTTESLDPILIPPPNRLRNGNMYIVFSNKSAATVSLMRGSAFVPFYDPDNPGAQDNTINSNRTAIYKGSVDMFRNISFYRAAGGLESVAYKPSFIYSYEFNGKQAALTDVRPLTRIGEPTWSEGVPDAAHPLVFAEYGDRSVKVIASANSVTAITLNAAGQRIASRSNQENNAGAVIAAMSTAEDAYITAGHTAGTLPRSVVEKRSPDDTLIWTIPFRQKRGAMYARLYALARRNETTYLVAGMAGSNGIDDGAYLAEVSDKGSRGEVLWEMAPEAFKGENWKAVRTVSYNEKNNVYIVAGDCGGDKTFVGFIDPTEKVKNAGFVINNFLVAQALSDANGDFYVMGQEFRSGKSFAVVRKYAINGSMLWQQNVQLKENALYQCAAFDEDAIVLGGVMDAADEYGGKGAPFLHSVDCKTGDERWLAPLKGIQGAAIVVALQKAVDYGFIATFANVDSRGNWVAPQIGRLNARGRLVNHTSY
ncbi:MAG: hypothetical protein LBK73_16475 [Treponema sp.]|jgi:hypothetical protein|nr:hypothetical protein [Treponema sp.]